MWARRMTEEGTEDDHLSRIHVNPPVTGWATSPQIQAGTGDLVSGKLTMNNSLVVDVKFRGPRR